MARFKLSAVKMWKKKTNTYLRRQQTNERREMQLKINIYDFQIILMINFDSRKNYLFKQFTWKTCRMQRILVKYLWVTATTKNWNAPNTHRRINQF